MAHSERKYVEGTTSDGQHKPLGAKTGVADHSGSSEPSSPTSPSPTSTATEDTLREKGDSKAEVASPALERGQNDSNQSGPTDQPSFGWLRRILKREAQEPYEPPPSQWEVPEIIKPVKLYPPGYGKVAASIDADPGFLVFRRFGWLHNYVLLELQDELAQLEQSLESHDRNEHKHGIAKRLKSRRMDIGMKESRHDLLTTIQKKLAEYDEMLFRVEKIQAMQRPLPRNQSSVCSIVHLENKMIGVEADWISRSDDLATVTRSAEHGWFNGWVEDLLYKISKKMLLRIFSNAEQKDRSEGSPRLILTSPQRLDALVRLILTLALCIELLVPLLVLNKMQTNNPANIQRMGFYQIVLIFVATLFFSASCSFFTRARRHEVFEATAAYCAVLVVFLGNTSNVNVVQQNT